MPLNLDKVLTTATGIVGQVLASSGTTVTLRRGADPLGATVNPTTLAVVTVEPTLTYADVPAILTPTSAVPVSDLPQGVPLTDGDVIVLVAPDTVVATGDTVEVTASRDTALVGRKFVVTHAEVSFAGVARRLVATRPGALRSTLNG